MTPGYGHFMGMECIPLWAAALNYEEYFTMMFMMMVFIMVIVSSVVTDRYGTVSC